MVELTPKNVHAYRRIIGEYEGHDLRITSEGKVFIDGQNPLLTHLKRITIG